MPGAHFGFVVANIDVVLVIKPCRYSVPPPELPADTPVLDISHPGEIGVLPVFRNELDVTVLHGLDRRFGQGFYRNVPLIGEIGLYDHSAAITAGDF